jgi:mannose-6-phosphate isomerase
MSIILYPLKFNAVLKEKIWGGHRLEPLVGAPATDKAIGEAWLVHEDSTVAEGPYTGRTLAELVRAHPAELLGTLGSGFVVDGVARFPLLAKFLDANEWLSIQLHPDDAYARSHENAPYGKCEFWYVLHAEPGSRIIHGLKAPLSPDALKAAAQSGAIKDMFDRVALQPGDVVINMPGVIHALGEGLVIYELQQSSDITYRLYDWDRPASAGRELHLDKSADVADVHPIKTHTIAPIVIDAPNVTRSMLTACRYFASERLDVRSATTEHTRGASCHILTAIAGSGVIGTRQHETSLHAGESVVIPAAIGEYVIASDSGLSVIKGWVPDLQTDIFAPLLAQGVGREQLAQLGGELRRSDLATVIG